MPNRPKISQKLRKEVYKKCGGKCYYCGCALRLNTFKADHRYAYAKGGRTDYRNLVASCTTCNTIKADYSIEEFRQKLIELANKNRTISELVRNKYNLAGHVTDLLFSFELRNKEKSDDVWKKLSA